MIVRGADFKLEFWLLSQTTRVTDAWLRRMQAAYSIGWASCAHDWGAPTPSVSCASSMKDIPDHGVPVVYSPSIDVPGDLAYHTFSDGRPSSLVLADESVSDGDVETGGSHEGNETIGDFDANEWFTLPSGARMPIENSDPTEGDILPIDIGQGAPVNTSNYVKPAWFTWTGETAELGELDAAHLFTVPRYVRPDGYMLIVDPGGNVRQLGQGPAAYKNHPRFRHGRRLAAAHRLAQQIRFAKARGLPTTA